MNKCVSLFLLAFVGYVAAAGSSSYYAGTTVNGTLTATPPVVSGTGVCSTGTGSSPYVKATVNITATNYYFVTAMFDDTAVSNGLVALYPTGANTYTPGTPCANALMVAQSQPGGGPHLFAAISITAGLYTLVVTTTTAADAGVFSVHIDPVTFTGNTNNDPNYWYYPEYNTYPCYSTGYSAAYISFTWTQATTGYMDINVVAQNATVASSFNIEAALFNSTNLGWLGQGNFTDPLDPCAQTSSNSYFVWAAESDSVTRLTYGYGVGAVFGQVWLTAGWNYTIVVGTDDYNYNAAFAVRVAPTIYFNIGTNANFDIPSLGTEAGSCAAGGTGKVWRAHIFTVQYPSYVVDTGPSGVGFDTISALYAGNNGGSADQVTPPSACTGFLQVVDTGDVGPLSATGLATGHNYTVIVSTYSDSAPSPPGLYTLFLYTGQYLGIPVTTGTGGLTGGMTTGSDATTATFSILLVIISLIASLF